MDFTFFTSVDGPGEHGEVVAIQTNDAKLTRQARNELKLKSTIAFNITTDSG